MDDEVILVDKKDRQIGTEAKLKAHEQGKLHRAFSIFIFNSRGKLLLQKRAAGKYHSGGLWSNTCCSHPRPGEPTDVAAHRRLEEEMGFDCDLKEIFSFIYKVSLDNGITEHELDHVFIGYFEGKPEPNSSEVEGAKWIESDFLVRDIKHNPDIYTYWLRQCYDRVIKEWRKRDFPELL